MQFSSSKLFRKRHAHLFLLILCYITICNSISTKTLSQNCLCDITDSCDNECCCDQQCPSAYINEWLSHGFCQDDSLVIPMCKNIGNTISKDDLYSGLRTIYTIIRRLFCISRINFVNFENYYATTLDNTNINRLTADTGVSTLSAISPRLSSLQVLSTITNIPLKNSLGICQAGTGARFLNQVPFQKCKVFLQTSSIATNSLLSVSQIQGNINANLKIYDGKKQGTSSATPLTGSITTSCPGANCQNVVKYLKLVFTVSGNTATLSTANSYAIVGQISASSIPFYTSYSYTIQFLNQDSSISHSANIAYNAGSPLQLLYQVKSTSGTASTFTYSQINNPIYIGYRQTDGKCRQSQTDSDDSSPIYLQLGKNMAISCIASTGGKALFNQISLIFNKIGISGSPSKVGDYISINNLDTITTQQTQDIKLTIFYTKVGSELSPQYRIINAVAATQQPKRNLITLYIQYHQITNNKILYVPDPPKAQAYLPNDFLYPFVIA